MGYSARYHATSLIAVFLALAIGIVVGSTALKPAVLSGLQKTADAERKRIDALYAQNNLNKQQIAADQAYAQAGEHQMLSGLLDGQRVVLVTAPGFPGGVVTGVTSALAEAGRNTRAASRAPSAMGIQRFSITWILRSSSVTVVVGARFSATELESRAAAAKAGTAAPIKPRTCRLLVIPKLPG